MQKNHVGRWRRRVILWGAAVLGVAVAVLVAGPRGTDERPDDALIHSAIAAQPASDGRAAQADKAEASPKPSTAPSAASAWPAASTPPTPAASTPPAKDGATTGATDSGAAEKDSTSPDIRIDRHGVVIGPRHHGAKIRVEGLDSDREYDSFDQFVNEQPWLAALVFAAVFGVFLVPLLIIVLLIWYKMRKARMQNETMLKLAERGAPPEAIAALASGSTRATFEPEPRQPGAQTPPNQPRYMATLHIGRDTRASDLRKGVILLAIGLAFVFYSMINEAQASWVGLVLLFLGVGYCILWIFEDRKVPPTPVPPPGPPSAGGT